MRHSAKPVDPSGSVSSLDPVEALRIIRAILGDRSMTFGERVAAAGVVLRADNATRVAWAPYTSLEADFGVSARIASDVLRRNDTRLFGGNRRASAPPLPTANTAARSDTHPLNDGSS